MQFACRRGLSKLTDGEDFDQPLLAGARCFIMISFDALIKLIIIKKACEQRRQGEMED